MDDIKNKRKGWKGFFLVPVGSIIIFCVVWWDSGQCVGICQIIVVEMLLIINLATCYLKRQLRFYTGIRVENELLKRQNEYFRIRYEEFEDQWLKLRRVRHDMTNNCVLEMDYLEKGQYHQLMEHYRAQIGRIKGQRNTVYTGNIGIDSIVNYKLKMAEELQITVERRIEIADAVTISNVELNILIGNLMDNAIEAVKNMEVYKKMISFFIRTDKTAFFLEISNPYVGERKKDDQGNFLTDKKDRSYHGLGLGEVKDIVRKHDGRLMVETDEGRFHIKVFLYMNSDCR